jgi:hypothetical protein
MTNEIAFLMALALTAVASVLVVIYLRRPLLRILCDLCGTQERARFWAAFSHVLLVLVPLVVVMLARPEAAKGPPLFVVIDQLKWALAGLILAVMVVGMAVASFVATVPRITIHPGQMDDLQRLLARVEEIRAREIVSRASEYPGSSSPPSADLQRLVAKTEQIRGKERAGSGEAAG